MIYKRYKNIIIIGCIFLLLLCIIPIPIKIDQSISGIELSPTDSNNTNDVKITVKGTFYWKMIKLLGKDQFRGNISIDRYPFTEEKILNNNQAFQIIYHDSVPMQYYNKKDIFDFDIETLGFLGTTWKLKHFAILVQIDPLNPTFIVANSRNREQALEELKFLKKAFDGIVEYKQLNIQ